MAAAPRRKPKAEVAEPNPILAVPARKPRKSARIAAGTRTSPAKRRKKVPVSKTSSLMTPSERHKVYIALGLIVFTMLCVAVAGGEVSRGADGSLRFQLRDKRGHAWSPRIEVH